MSFVKHSLSIALLASASLLIGCATPAPPAPPAAACLLYTSPSPRDGLLSRMPSSA